METALTPLLWFCALGCGLMAGVYFAFSAFVMAALARIDAGAGSAAMNSINAVILRSAFMPLFLGTTVCALVLVGLGLLTGLRFPGAPWFAAGGAIYVIGMFGVTMLRNVPLNDALAAAARRPDARDAWERYVRTWTRWNHARTLASLVAAACFIAAM